MSKKAAMKCSDVEKRLSAYIDGALPVAKGSSLEAHLAACGPCAAALAALRDVISRLASPAKAPPMEVWGRIQATIEDRRRRPLREALRRFLPSTAAAAAGILIVLGAYSISEPRSSPPQSPPLTVEEQCLSEALEAASSVRVTDLRQTKIDPPVEDLVLAKLLERRRR